MQIKKHWIGQKWYLPGAAGNDIHKVNYTVRFSSMAIDSLFADQCADDPSGIPSCDPGRRARSHPSWLSRTECTSNGQSPRSSLSHSFFPCEQAQPHAIEGVRCRRSSHGSGISDGHVHPSSRPLEHGLERVCCSSGNVTEQPDGYSSWWPWVGNRVWDDGTGRRASSRRRCCGAGGEGSEEEE